MFSYEIREQRIFREQRIRHVKMTINWKSSAHLNIKGKRNTKKLLEVLQTLSTEHESSELESWERFVTNH